MNFGEVETRARRYARMSTSGASQTIVFGLINDAITAFGEDVFGLPYKEYLTLAASFDLETQQAFNLTIVGGTNAMTTTDVVVTSADASTQTGDQVATMLQAQIRAAVGEGTNLTVAWSKFKFTIDAIDSTSIAIASPADSVTYTDYIDELFGGSQSVTATSVECDFPEHCTMEASLNGNSIRVNKVFWDTWLLAPTPRDYVIDPLATGTPSYYNIRGDKIRITPVPIEQKKWYIEYTGVPSQVTSPAESTAIPDIPTKYQRALAYWVAKELLLESFEAETGRNLYGEYRQIVNQYKLDYANNSTATKTTPVNNLWYGVE